MPAEAIVLTTALSATIDCETQAPDDDTTINGTDTDRTNRGHQIISGRIRIDPLTVPDQLSMEVQVFEASNGDCPYLDDLEWVSYMFRVDSIKNSVYEKLLDNGFRRSGHFFYKNKCPNCNACISIRIRIDQFSMSRSQRRIWRKNQDLRIVSHPVVFDDEGFDLYRRYCRWKHQSETSEENYRDFLIASAVDTIMMRYYDGDTLAGIGWVDLLDDSLSSVYFAFSQDYAKRSLGIFSVLKEIELARELSRPYLHMGFWVAECQAMSYKTQFKPYQFLQNGAWQDPESVR